MKFFPVLFLTVLAGCQMAPASSPLLPLPHPVPEPKAIAVETPPVVPISETNSRVAELEKALAQKTQVIEALLSQNDALAAQNAPAPPVAPLPEVKVPAAPPPAQPAAPAPVVALPVPVAAPQTWLTPNADGVIDLAVAEAPPGEPVNPFAVRRTAPESVREVSLRVGGTVAGTRPCALINDRIVQAGESIESLTLDRVESGAAFLRAGSRLLRLPVDAKPVRVRLAL